MAFGGVRSVRDFGAVSHVRGGDHQRTGGPGVLRGAGRGDGRVRRRFEPVYGGFSLCKHPRDITLLDIVSSTESTIKISYCLEQNAEESKEEYQTVRSMYNFYHDLQDEIEERFSHKTLEQLLNKS